MFGTDSRHLFAKCNRGMIPSDAFFTMCYDNCHNASAQVPAKRTGTEFTSLRLAHLAEFLDPAIVFFLADLAAFALCGQNRQLVFQ